MNTALDDNELELQGLARQITARRSTPERLGEIEESADRFDRVLWSELAEAGLLGAGLAEDDGGLGLGMVGAALVAMEVGRTVAAVPYAAVSAAAAVLARHGSAEQKEQWLARIVGGEALVVVAPMQSSVGSASQRRPRCPGRRSGCRGRTSPTRCCFVVGDAVLLVDPHGDGAVAATGRDDGATGRTRPRVRATWLSSGSPVTDAADVPDRVLVDACWRRRRPGSPTPRCG